MLGREASPLTFVVSLRLGEPPSLDPLQSRLEHYPTLRFKLDATSSWTPELIEALVAPGRSTRSTSSPSTTARSSTSHPTQCSTGASSRVSGRLARGSRCGHARDRRRARRRSRPDQLGRADPLDRRHRVVAVRAAGWSTSSRRGSAGLPKLCATYDYCVESGIGAYGGGQFELGPGRGQAQYLASLFHPDTPNDLAPVGFHDNDPRPGLEASPLTPAPSAIGFRWESS